MKKITDENYKIKGYAKKKIYDVKGDVIGQEYYAEYDETEPIEDNRFKRLKVRETRVITRESTLGLPKKIDVTIEWISGDGVTTRASKTLSKPINSYDGMRMNEASRKRLVAIAQGYLLGQVGLLNTQEFGSDVAVKRSAYISGSRYALIDAINNSTRSYMTTSIKAGLISILDIAY